jgi:Transcriptional regulator, AbiEi antitoxin/AbiEi antitoxin C-terminal domain
VTDKAPYWGQIRHALAMADTFDRLIAAVAGKQYGYIMREQLLAIGLGRRAIQYRIETGRLIPVYPGVYAVGHVNSTPVARAFAAVLACGKGAVLGYGSAATLWGFNKYWDAPFEVIAPTNRKHEGIRVHRSRTLTRQDITRQLGVPVTTPERTVLDIATRMSDERLTRVVNDGRRSGFLHLNDLADALDRNPRHPGRKRLMRFVEDSRDHTNSPLEDEFLEFAKRYGLPEPVTNTHVLGYEVDVLFEAEKVIVELDGWEFHRFRSNFESDRNRDADMLAADFVTVRVTRERMHRDPGHEARRLITILEGRRRRAA